jgi:hypothetical protein
VPEPSLGATERPRAEPQVRASTTWNYAQLVGGEREWPAELDGLIEAVVTAEDPYDATTEVTACATANGFLDMSAVESALYLIWVALEDRYELLPEAEDARTFALMRRAAEEWGPAKDDPTSRAAYLDRWQYEELGYKRRVPKGWALHYENRPDGSVRTEARSPDGNAVYATAASSYEAEDEIRRKSFAAAERSATREGRDP